MYNEKSTHDILKYNLGKYLPIRIVLKKDNNDLLGYTEESFSMSWSRHFVRIYWSGKAYSMLGEHLLDANVDVEKFSNNKEYLVLDPLLSDCPVDIDWSAWYNATTKFNKRNAPFKVKV